MFNYQNLLITRYFHVLVLEIRSRLRVVYFDQKGFITNTSYALKIDTLSFNLFNNFGGITTDYNVILYIFGNYCSCCDNNIVSYRYSRVDDGTSSNPYIVPKRNRFCIFFARITFGWIQWMCCCIDLYTWSKHTIISETHLTNI